MSLAITRVTAPQAKYNLKCPYAMKPTRIVIHDTANDASAMSEISYMLSNSLSTSFHFAVDDTRAVQGLPLDRNGWHAGDGASGKGNREGIGIEVCYSKSGGSRYMAARKNAAKLTAILLKQYGWGVGRVTKHQDYSGKTCPHRNLSLGWSLFLQLVQGELNILNGENVSPQAPKIDTGSKVKIIGTNYATGQIIPSWVKNSVHTVARVVGDRTLLNEINSWVYTKDLAAI